MNFTCTASIIGFIVAGRHLNGGPHSRIQVWRKNSSENSPVYYQASQNVPVNVPSNRLSGGVCLAVRRIVEDSFWCILRDNWKVSVKPGDILGLELPRTGGDEILFTSGGLINYEFENRLPVGSNVNLSRIPNGSYSNTQQLPQILFNFTSGIVAYSSCVITFTAVWTWSALPISVDQTSTHEYLKVFCVDVAHYA